MTSTASWPPSTPGHGRRWTPWRTRSWSVRSWSSPAPPSSQTRRRLPPTAKKEIDSISSELKRSQNGTEGVTFLVAGHTDNAGSENYNYALGQKRANAVASYLVSQKQIDRARVMPVSYGESAPMLDNSTAKGTRDESAGGDHGLSRRRFAVQSLRAVRRPIRCRRRRRRPRSSTCRIASSGSVFSRGSREGGFAPSFLVAARDPGRVDRLRGALDSHSEPAHTFGHFEPRDWRRRCSRRSSLRRPTRPAK